MFRLVKVINFRYDLHAFFHLNVTVCFINFISTCADSRISLLVNSEVLLLINYAIFGTEQFTIKAHLVILLIFAVTRRNSSTMVAAQSSDSKRKLNFMRAIFLTYLAE